MAFQKLKYDGTNGKLVGDDGTGTTVPIELDDLRLPGQSTDLIDNLNADQVDGKDASQLGSSVSQGGGNIEDPATTIDFTGNLLASGDGSGTATISIDQGKDSGLNADKLDGSHASDLGSSVSNGGTEVTASATDLDFGSGLTAVDDGDGTSTISVDNQNSSLSDLTVPSDFNINNADKFGLPHRTSDPSASAGDMWYRTDLD